MAAEQQWWKHITRPPANVRWLAVIAFVGPLACSHDPCADGCLMPNGSWHAYSQGGGEQTVGSSSGWLARDRESIEDHHVDFAVHTPPGYLVITASATDEAFAGASIDVNDAGPDADAAADAAADAGVDARAPEEAGSEDAADGSCRSCGVSWTFRIVATRPPPGTSSLESVHAVAYYCQEGFAPWPPLNDDDVSTLAPKQCAFDEQPAVESLVGTITVSGSYATSPSERDSYLIDVPRDPARRFAMHLEGSFTRVYTPTGECY